MSDCLYRVCVPHKAARQDTYKKHHGYHSAVAKSADSKCKKFCRTISSLSLLKALAADTVEGYSGIPCTTQRCCPRCGYYASVAPTKHNQIYLTSPKKKYSDQEIKWPSLYVMPVSPKPLEGSVGILSSFHNLSHLWETTRFWLTVGWASVNGWPDPTFSVHNPPPDSSTTRSEASPAPLSPSCGGFAAGLSGAVYIFSGSGPTRVNFPVLGRIDPLEGPRAMSYFGVWLLAADEDINKGVTFKLLKRTLIDSMGSSYTYVCVCVVCTQVHHFKLLLIPPVSRHCILCSNWCGSQRKFVFLQVNLAKYSTADFASSGSVIFRLKNRMKLHPQYLDISVIFHIDKKYVRSFDK